MKKRWMAVALTAILLMAVRSRQTFTTCTLWNGISARPAVAMPFGRRSVP